MGALLSDFTHPTFPLRCNAVTPLKENARCLSA